MRALGILAAAATAAFGVAACGDDSGGGASGNAGGDNPQLVDALVDEGATQQEAECMVDELGDDAEFLLSADEPDLPEDAIDRLLAAVQECSGSDIELDE